MDECPACGAAIGPDDEFCPSCGARAGGATESFEAVVEPAPAAPAADLGVSDVPVLVVRKGVEVGERFYLESPEISIGRDPDSDIFLNDVTVSRAHARLHVTDAGVRLVDVGSLNGTYVNDALVTDVLLQSGDTVQIGRFQMVYLCGGGA